MEYLDYWPVVLLLMQAVSLWASLRVRVIKLDGENREVKISPYKNKLKNRLRKPIYNDDETLYRREIDQDA